MNGILILFFFFFIDLWGLIQVGRFIGAFPAMLLVILTGVIGFYFARREGLRAYQLAMIQIKNKQVPGHALLDGVCILLGGFLLVMPGFLSDILGLLLLFPYTRGFFKLFLLIWIERKIRSGKWIMSWRRR